MYTTTQGRRPPVINTKVESVYRILAWVVFAAVVLEEAVKYLAAPVVYDHARLEVDTADS